MTLLLERDAIASMNCSLGLPVSNSNDIAYGAAMPLAWTTDATNHCTVMATVIGNLIGHYSASLIASLIRVKRGARCVLRASLRARWLASCVVTSFAIFLFRLAKPFESELTRKPVRVPEF